MKSKVKAELVCRYHLAVDKWWRGGKNILFSFEFPCNCILKDGKGVELHLSQFMASPMPVLGL